MRDGGAHVISSASFRNLRSRFCDPTGTGASLGSESHPDVRPAGSPAARPCGSCEGSPSGAGGAGSVLLGCVWSQRYLLTTAMTVYSADPAKDSHFFSKL